VYQNVKNTFQDFRDKNKLIDWTQIWTKLKNIKVTNQVKEFQWKCLNNINYTEHRLKKNEFVKRKMPLCQIRDNDETMQNLFFKCTSVKKIIKEIKAIVF
jgi:hypothetical protein